LAYPHVSKPNDLAVHRDGTILSLCRGDASTRYPWISLKLTLPDLNVRRGHRARIGLWWNVNERQFRRDSRWVKLAAENRDLYAWVIERLVEFDPGPDGSLGRRRWQEEGRPEPAR
jgi:hypothetical protein